MNIEIKDYEGYIIELSDESLDNDNFVDITIRNDDSTSILTTTVSLDELFSALTAFDSQRSRRIKRMV